MANDLTPLLNRFPPFHRGCRIARLAGAGGFSGAMLWRLDASDQSFCLRRWPPEHPTRERLAFIHAVLRHVAQQGIRPIAVPLPDREGQTMAAYDGAWWEVTEWLPGVADYDRNPSLVKLSAAMRILAEFHLAAASFQPLVRQPSPGLVERVRQTQAWLNGDLARAERSIETGDWPRFADLARQFLPRAPRALNQLLRPLQAASEIQVSQQPCIRDVWHDHILFTGDQVSGVVDFGAMNVDNVTCDVARLVGSLAGDDAAQRAAALEAYESLRRLTDEERILFELFDESTIVLGGLNWLRWVYLERRSFENRERVERRLEWLLDRLQRHGRGILPRV